MLTVILVELGLAVVAGLAFAIWYASGPWRRTAAGRHLMAMTVATVVEAGTLLLLGLGLRVPVWIFAAAYAAIDAVLVHRLVLLWRARRRDGKVTT